MPASKSVPTRRPAKATVASVRQGPAHRAPIAAAHFVDDAFFRHLVAHMRNGVLAIDRGGALVLINDEAKMPVTLALGSFSTRYTQQLNLMAAAAMLVALPVLVLYAFFQRQFIQGVLSGALKG